MSAELRRLSDTGLSVSPVGLGCWPISGMSSVDVNERDSLATLEAAIEHGISFFDTAYGYGARGESERLIARVLQGRRDQVVVATKGGIHWDKDGQRVLDGSPQRLRQECEESLQRLGTDRVELLYLHAPDPNVPVAESAGGLAELQREGKALAIGASNLSVEQLTEFHAVCPVAAVQPPYNMLQRQIEQDIIPWCRERDVAVVSYWPLMKGLLAGKLSRNHVFQPGDGRAKYPMFQGDEWQRNQDFVDELRNIADHCGRTVAQVVVNWTLHQPGITSVLCGAKRAYQIEETAAAMGWRLSDEQLARIDAALERRGDVVTRPPV